MKQNNLVEVAFSSPVLGMRQVWTQIPALLTFFAILALDKSLTLYEPQLSHL